MHEGRAGRVCSAYARIAQEHGYDVLDLGFSINVFLKNDVLGVTSLSDPSEARIFAKA